MRESQLFFEVVFRDKYSLVETISKTYRPPCYIIVKHTWIYNEKENDDIESFFGLKQQVLWRKKYREANYVHDRNGSSK